MPRRKRFKKKASSVNESTSLLKSKLLYRSSKRKRSWTSRQSFPSAKHSGLASGFFSTTVLGGTVGVGSATPAIAAELQARVQAANTAPVCRQTDLPACLVWKAAF